MKSEKLNEIRNQLGLLTGTWYTLYDIDSILMKDGRGVYPNYKFLRFLFTENEIYVKHGKSTPYGARLSTKFSISSTRMAVSFQYGPIISSVSYHSDFRVPRSGDILVASDSKGNVVSESVIESVIFGMNGTMITLLTPITLNNDVLLSFYDPQMYSKDLCVHGTIDPGVYLKFLENENGINHKKYGKYHEILKDRNIISIDLKLISKKTYTTK